MRCWWCGVEPVEVYDVHVMERAEPVRQIPHWPGGDHAHSEHPPTADEMADAAQRLLSQRVG